MNWEAIGAVGELAGALAVVITLVYFARQLRSMQTSTFSEELRAITTDEIQLEKLRLEHSGILVRGNSGEELSSQEIYEIARIFNAHETFAFHGHLREKALGYEVDIRATSFATLLEDNPILIDEFNAKNFPYIITNMVFL